jgi:UDP-glucose 4,6-dehydratase
MVKKYPAVKWICIDKMNYCASMNNLSDILNEPNFMFVKGDITSVDLINHLFKSEKVDTVMHFAAESHVGT